MEGALSLGRSIYGTNPETGYVPQPIPSRGSLPQRSYDAVGKRQRKAEPGYEAFAEIDLADDQSDLRVFGGGSQPIETTFDEARSLFCEMKQIARQGYWRNEGKAEIFFKQADFMSLFEDDYAHTVHFSQRYPHYQKMTYEQLRTYFTWRSLARSGHLTVTSISYAYLYAYELLNNIGVESPEEGLEKLVELWRVFREQDSAIDRHFLGWFKDYHVFYPVKETFRTFVAQQDIQRLYPTVFCFDSNESDRFDAFAEISSYDIKGSIFYPEAPDDLIRGCFLFALDRLREVLEEKGEHFEDYILFTTEKKVRWAPFKKALFLPVHTQDDRIVRISAYEEYECVDNTWTGTVVIPDESGKQIIGYIMKEVEVFVRGIDKFRYKLNANLDSFKSIDQDSLLQKGISLPSLVKESCAEFYKRYTWRDVSVDLGNLTQIRREAFDTQGKLLVPDENDSAKAPVPEPSPPLPVIPAPIASSAPTGTSDVWLEFKASLSATELEALGVALSQGSLSSFAREHATMLEVLVDSLNEKAMDHIGDAIMEVDDPLIIYDEYLQDLKRLVSS